MPTAVQPAVAPGVRPAPRAATVPLFAAALFLSALLLFAVQPMFTKMVLPVLGGSPAVWSIALVFFQALLLAGYCYAHLLARYASTRRGAGAASRAHARRRAEPADLHSGRLDERAGGRRGVLAARSLRRLGRAAVLRACRQRAPAAGLVLALGSSARRATRISSTPPRMSGRLRPSSPIRSRSSRSCGCRSRPPAGASALRALAVLIGGCGLLGGARPEPRATAADESATAATAPARWRERAGWVGLAFVPSGLLVAVTAHISTDIAAAPLLWVVPLALFLVTFVLAFRDKALVRPAMLARLQVWGTALALMTAIASVPLARWAGTSSRPLLRQRDAVPWRALPPQARRSRA